MPDVAEVGVGAVVTLLILKEVFAFVRVKKSPSANGRCPHAACEERMAGLAHFANEMLRVHGKVDSDGVPVWYIRESTRIAMDRVPGTLEEIKRLLVALEKRCASRHP